MTWKDKLEIGLKDDAPFRRDNLPDFQKKKGGPEKKPGDKTRSAEEPGARQDAVAAARPVRRSSAARTKPRSSAAATVRQTKPPPRKHR